MLEHASRALPQLLQPHGADMTTFVCNWHQNPGVPWRARRDMAALCLPSAPLLIGGARASAVADGLAFSSLGAQSSGITSTSYRSNVNGNAFVVGSPPSHSHRNLDVSCSARNSSTIARSGRLSREFVGIKTKGKRRRRGGRSSDDEDDGFGGFDGGSGSGGSGWGGYRPGGSGWNGDHYSHGDQFLFDCQWLWHLVCMASLLHALHFAALGQRKAAGQELVVASTA